MLLLCNQVRRYINLAKLIYFNNYIISRFKNLACVQNMFICYCLKGAVYKGRPANGEGVVLKFRTFPEGGGF